MTRGSRGDMPREPGLYRPVFVSVTADVRHWPIAVFGHAEVENTIHVAFDAGVFVPDLR